MKTENFLIRIASLDDLNQLTILFDQYRVFYKYKSDPDQALSFLSERMARNESQIFVAEASEGKLVGFVQLYPLFSSTRMNKLWVLNDLFITPDFRGLKVSIQLIDEAKRFAAETNALGLLLETAKSNDIGNSLYRRTGFVLDVDHHYYSWIQE